MELRERLEKDPNFKITDHVVVPLDAFEREVRAERRRQHAKFGEQNLPDGTGDPKYRQIAQEAREICNASAAQGTCTYRAILQEEIYEAFAEKDPLKLRAELIQVAAVVKQWIEAIDRRILNAGNQQQPKATHDSDHA